MQLVYFHDNFVFVLLGEPAMPRKIITFVFNVNGSPSKGVKVTMLLLYAHFAFLSANILCL